MPFAFIRVCVSKEFNEQTGNYYYGASYYHTKLSIFISVDPLAEKTGDAYGYCYNNQYYLLILRVETQT
jgi:RHS repeat-associated protein